MLHCIRTLQGLFPRHGVSGWPLRAALCLLLLLAAARSQGAELDQWLSRESARIDPTKTVVRAGRDGMVYVLTWKELARGYVLRMAPDGSGRTSAITGGSCMIATANARGEMGTSHWSWKGSSVEFRDRDMRVMSRPKLVNTQIEAGGETGDFYLRSDDGLVRVASSGKVGQRYAIDAAVLGQQPAAFRVNEKQGAFYILVQGAIHCVKFDGKEAWKLPVSLRVHNALGRSGQHVPFDVSDDGLLYAFDPPSGDIRVYDASPAAAAPPKIKTTLDLPDDQVPKWSRPQSSGFVSDVCVTGDSLLVRRLDVAAPDEFFQRYDRKTGRLVQVVRGNFVHLRVSYPEEVWTAGAKVPMQITLETPGERMEPRWRVWASPFGSGEWRELAFDGARISVLADGAGVYRIRISPELDPSRPLRSTNELAVDGVVEIRTPGASGTLSLWTPANRPSYGRGEEIPVTVRLRAPGGGARQAVVRLVSADRRTSIAEWPVSVAADRDAVVRVPTSLTRMLGPGAYRLTAAADGLSVAEQALWIGPGIETPAFQVIQYADYGTVYPAGLDVWDLADGTRAATDRLRKLGVTLAVDRFGVVLPPQLPDWNYVRKNQPLPWQKTSDRLAADPAAAAPEKLVVAPCVPQTLGWFSAKGIQQMSILLNNDAGMPLGRGFDNRTPDEMCASMRRVNDVALPYPAFRGWIWAANWFTFKGRGATAGRTDEEKEAYRVAMTNAVETGRWSPVLETVCDLRLSWGTDAIKLFRKTLDEAKRPDLRTAMSGPFRNVESYPPVTFADVDEVDLQAQWEQVALPYHVPYSVDFYKRPGKNVLCHPELGNDNGTGDQFLPNAFAAIMRGSDSMGFHYGWGYRPIDSRTSQGGCCSQNLAFLPLMQSLGPWLAAQERRDPVAIVASSRMFKTDKWHRAMGVHFARVFEAWLACLHAHYPAGIVFSEDLTPATLKKYKAVLVVDQWIEPEPALAEALKSAAAAGVRIFYDATSRESLMKGFEPLGFAFDKMEQDEAPAGDEAAYWRLPQFIKADAAALLAKLAQAVPAVAATDNPEVLLTERAAEQGRYLFVVNNTTPEMEPGLLWRMDMFITVRTPVQAAVRWDVPASAAVYELFAQKPAQRKDGAVVADLQYQPCRLFAALPAAIERVALSGPAACRAGQKLAWTLHVQDRDGSAIAAAVPAAVRLLAKDGAVLARADVSSGSKGASGELQVPLDAAAGEMFLEAQERLSGQAARLPVRLDACPLPVSVPSGPPTVAAADKAASAAKAFLPAPQERFGPHLRDVAVSASGQLALMNAFNWDRNLYGVDLETGALRFQRRLANYFTFAPQPLAGGFAVQGFDFNTPEGYHMYLLGDDGTPQRRFALTAYPGRLPHRFLATLLNDRVNNFAVSPDGSWVAAAGDLGLAVWDRAGKLLWSEEWWKTERKEIRLLAASGNSLLVFDEGQMRDVDPLSGKPKGPPVVVEEAGKITSVCRGGETVFVGGDADDGCVLAVRGGRIVRRFPMTWSEIVPLPDGSGAAVTDKRDLRIVSVETGLRWVYRADEVLRSPRISPDGKRVAVCSDLGMLYVVSVDGVMLLERDLGALCVPAWLPGGDLLLASWMGEVSRLDAAYRPKWRTLLRADTDDMRGKMLAPDATPTARVAWSNAERTPLPLTPNVLADIGSKGLTVRLAIGETRKGVEDASLVDGEAAPPAAPLIAWERLPNMAVGNQKPALEIELKHRRARVDAVTLAEDPQHPESWLRDFAFEVWDDAKQDWVHVQDCLSNAAVHTHRLAAPAIGNLFRLVSQGRFCGNLRLEEIAFHGEDLGAIKDPAKSGGKASKQPPAAGGKATKQPPAAGGKAAKQPAAD